MSVIHTHTYKKSWKGENAIKKTMQSSAPAQERPHLKRNTSTHESRLIATLTQQHQTPQAPTAPPPLVHQEKDSSGAETEQDSQEQTEKNMNRHDGRFASTPQGTIAPWTAPTLFCPASKKHTGLQKSSRKRTWSQGYIKPNSNQEEEEEEAKQTHNTLFCSKLSVPTGNGQSFLTVSSGNPSSFSTSSSPSSPTSTSAPSSSSSR